MKFTDLTMDFVKHCLQETMYSFDKFGETKEFSAHNIDQSGVHRKMGNHNHTYTWEKFGVYWFFSKEECEKKANEYIQKLGIPVSKFKRVYNYINNYDSYLNDKALYYKDKDGKIYESHLGDINIYEKDTQQFVMAYEYDDDWGGGYDTEEFPISEYGKTWAIYKKDLEGDKKDG